MKNDLFEHFIQYENDNKLFDIEIETFKIWEILRTYIYIDLEIIFKDLQPLFPQVQNNKRKIKISNILNGFKIFFLKNIDYVFLNNPRRVKQNDGKYYCIYTDLMIDLLKDKYKTVTFEDPYWALSTSSEISHFEPIKTENIVFLDIIEYIFRYRKFFLKKFNKKRYNCIHNSILDIKNKIEKEFNCDLTSIFKIAEEKVLYMILLKKTYKRIIKRINPKAIFEFYDAFPSKITLNKIAKELNIPIIEIQHGIVTEKNPIFLKYKNIERNYDCLPDYVLSFGKKLINTNYMPINKNHIFYIGNLFLDKKLKEYSFNLNKTNKKNILFISQSNLGKYISDFASKLSDLLINDPEYHIIYKMHPYEIDRKYHNLDKKNITVINNREKDLYYYQSISIAQVGVYSTGLYEGLVFGLNTFIIDLNYGTKEIKDMLKDCSNVTCVKNVEELKKKIKNIKKNTKKENYWHIVNKEKILKIISSIN